MQRKVDLCWEKLFPEFQRDFPLCGSTAGSLQGVGLSFVGSAGHSSISRAGFGPKIIPVPLRMRGMGQEKLRELRLFSLEEKNFGETA